MLLCVNAAAQPDLGDGWQDVLDALDAVTPLVDDARPGLAFLEMHGVAGDPARWMTQTRTILSAFGCTARLGIGANKIAAFGAAYAGDGTVCSCGAERALLAPLPLTLLQVEPEIVQRLMLLGIDCLGDLAELPHGPFVRRFGKESSRWHELARGIDRRPFLPRVRTVAIEAAILGEGRVADEAQVFFALRMLLTRICTDLACCGKRAGALHLALELDDASTCVYDVPLSTPTADERTIFDMLRAKLENTTFHAPIVGLRLQARQLEEGGEAQALFGGDDVDPQRVAVAIARLEAMLGERVTRARTREAHLLEERFTYEPFTACRSERANCHPERRAEDGIDAATAFARSARDCRRSARRRTCVRRQKSGRSVRRTVARERTSLYRRADCTRRIRRRARRRQLRPHLPPRFPLVSPRYV